MKCSEKLSRREYQTELNSVLPTANI